MATKQLLARLEPVLGREAHRLTRSYVLWRPLPVELAVKEAVLIPCGADSPAAAVFTLILIADIASRGELVAPAEHFQYVRDGLDYSHGIHVPHGWHDQLRALAPAIAQSKQLFVPTTTCGLSGIYCGDAVYRVGPHRLEVPINVTTLGRELAMSVGSEFPDLDLPIEVGLFQPSLHDQFHAAWPEDVWAYHRWARRELRAAIRRCVPTND